MNTEWVLEELDKFLAMTEMRNGSGGGFFTVAHVTAAPDIEVTKQATVVEKILNRVIPHWRFEVPDDSANNRWSQHREAALRAREELIRKQEIEENLGESTPELSTAKLHPWIWSGASSLWQSRHFREAVEAAIKKLNTETQNKAGRRDASETALFRKVFSLDAAKPGRCRLRRMKNDGSDTYRSAQRGAMAFAEGIFAGIRNPLSHEADQDPSEQEALEYLAALSVLARWVNSAEVEAAS